MRIYWGEKLILRDELKELWREKNVFEVVQRLQGDVVREVPSRQTMRFEMKGQAYFRKLHTGVGWGEIFKNLLRGRLPVISARNEWLALSRLAELEVPSLIPVAYGEKGLNPARRLSFIVTRELYGMMQLDEYLRSNSSLDFKHKYQLLSAVAEIARTIHSNGLNHRDLYLCHFLLDPLVLESGVESSRPLLYLVDLHRAQLRQRVPRRWQVKDLASIYFSAMDMGLTQRDIGRFLIAYFELPLSQVLSQKRNLLQDVVRRAKQLYLREQRLFLRGLR